jgi:hypothetical protein
MLCVDGGVVLVTGRDVTVLVAVVAGEVEAEGSALGRGWASLVEQAPRATTRRSAEAPMATGRGLTTRDSTTRGASNRLRL